MTDTEHYIAPKESAAYNPQNIIHVSDLHQSLEEAVARAKKDKHEGAMVVLSLENLPMIIGSYNTPVAEEIMAKLLDELTQYVGKSSTISRADKTHLAIIFSQSSPEETITRMSEIHQITQQFGCKNASVPIHLVVKIASVSFPHIANTTDNVLEKMCVALSIVKNDPMRSYFAYSDIEKREVQAKHHMILAHYMQSAIQNKKLRLAFQPIINSQTGHIIYHESLLRIVGDDGKINSAGPFIPIAESMGFIDVVDDLVLEMVIEELHNSPDIQLAFNISNLTVMDKKWLKKAKKLMADPDIASRLVVEMTETAMHGELRHVSNFVATLQGLGCQIAIDDFGAGYTSFRQLKSLPVDIVKIDGYFVKDIVDNSDNMLFVKTLLDFTRGLGLKAVAEFVETGEIAKLLMELKVDYMQGNYFCPAVNYRSWVKGEKYI